MDIKVTVNGMDDLSPSTQKRITKVVQSTVNKEIWKERDSENRKTLTVIKEMPTIFTMFISTTYGMLIFLLSIAVIAIPAATIGGALYVANNSSVVQYKIQEQEVPAYVVPEQENLKKENPYVVTPASTEGR